MSRLSKRISRFLSDSGQVTVQKLNLLVYRISHHLELALAVLLTAGLIISVVQLIPSLLHLHVSSETAHSFSEFLEGVFTLMIGVEALKMLCKHSPGSTLEVLLFAMARAIVVEHTNVVFMVAGICCITLIFLIRKFLYVHDFDTEPEKDSIFASVNPEEHLFGPSVPIKPHQHQHLTRRECPNKNSSAPSPAEEEDAEVRSPFQPREREWGHDPEFQPQQTR